MHTDCYLNLNWTYLNSKNQQFAKSRFSIGQYSVLPQRKQVSMACVKHMPQANHLTIIFTTYSKYDIKALAIVLMRKSLNIYGQQQDYMLLQRSTLLYLSIEVPYTLCHKDNLGEKMAILERLKARPHSKPV